MYKVNFFEKKKMVQKPTIKNKGTKNKICLNSSYKFALKKINKKIIEINVNKIDPKII